MKKILNIIYLILLLTSIMFSQNRYLDKSVSTSGTGLSWATAWKGFANINWSLITPGDTLFISGGTDSLVYTEQFECGDVQGTASEYIVIIAGKYSSNPTGHSGRVIIDGSDYPAGGSLRFPVYFGGSNSYTTEYILFKGFELRGGQSGARGEYQLNNVIFDSLNIYHYCGLAGIYLEGGDGEGSFTGIDSVTVRNCTIISDVNWGCSGDNAETDGIYFKNATHSVAHNNYIRMRSQDEYAHVDCIQSQYSDGIVIYNNVLINDSVYSPEGGGMPIIVRNGDKSGNGYPVIIYNNYCYMGGIWYNGANLGYTFNTHGGDNAEGMSPTYIFHNTIVTNGPRLGGTSLEYFGENWDGVFLNNIVSMHGDGTASRWGFGTNEGIIDSIRNNLVWSEYNLGTNLFLSNSWAYSWATWQTAGGTGVSSDPDYIWNIGNEPDQGVLTGELQATSPAINAGEDLTYLKNYLQSTYGIVVDIEHDINGLTRDTENPTIGAYEYQSGEPTPAQTKKVRVIIIQ